MKYVKEYLEAAVQECKERHDYWQELTEEWNTTGDRELAKEAVKAHKSYIECMEHIIFSMLPNITK